MLTFSFSQEQLDIIRLINPEEAAAPPKLPFKIPVEEFSANKLQKVLGYLEGKQKHLLDGAIESGGSTNTQTEDNCTRPVIDASYQSVKKAVENSNNVIKKCATKAKSETACTRKKVYSSLGLDMVLRDRTSHGPPISEAVEHKDTCTDAKCDGCASNLRRSNSDGNLPKTTMSEAQKEHRVGY